MSIDEAIAKYKEITNTDAVCPAHCNIPCDKCLQESEQLAEWLEELKANRIALEKANGYLETNYRLGYSKAIDDFADFANDMPTVEMDDGTIRPMWLEEMAEQLKEGAENDNLRR